MSPARPLACPQCGVILPAETVGVPLALACPGCQAQLQVTVFPSFHRPAPSGSAPQPVLEEGEATCFYHAQKRAVVPCQACGRFLCALCDVEVEAQHFCPTCLQHSRDQGRLPALERSRVRYDNIVWSLLLLPVPLCLVTAPLTASAALGLIFWKWRAAPSLVARTRLRLALGAVVAVAELATVALMFSQMFFRR